MTDNKLYANKGDTIRAVSEDSCPLQTASVYGTSKMGPIMMSCHIRFLFGIMPNCAVLKQWKRTPISMSFFSDRGD